jgi:hypothetical protein
LPLDDSSSCVLLKAHSGVRTPTSALRKQRASRLTLNGHFNFKSPSQGGPALIMSERYPETAAMQPLQNSRFRPQQSQSGNAFNERHPETAQPQPYQSSEALPSARDKFAWSGSEGTRTLYLFVANEALSQMSYTPKLIIFQPRFPFESPVLLNGSIYMLEYISSTN